MIALMLSAIFGAGEAHFISAKVQYLSDTGTVVLNAENNKDEKIEVLVSLLDKDGNIASATATGANLVNISNSHISSLVGAKEFSINDIDREADKKNTARFVLDYSDVTTAVAQDTLTIKLADLAEKKIRVKFTFAKAKGLIVRAARTVIDPTLFQGQVFTLINSEGDSNLSEQATSYYGGTAGTTIPVKVYASTEEQDSDGSNGALVRGRFTMSTELEGKTVTVVALADYDANGLADVIVGETQGIMKSGIMQTEMLMEKALPEFNSALNPKFDKGVFDGLGIAFIAYMKDDLAISNKGKLKQSDLKNPGNFNIYGDHNATDSVVIKSELASAIKIGTFDRTMKFLDLQWEDPYINYYVLDDNQSSTEQNISLTAIDKYGNPAYTGVIANTSCDIEDEYQYFEIDCGIDFSAPNFGIMTKRITIKPNFVGSNTPTRYDTSASVNRVVGEDVQRKLQMQVAGTGGLSSSSVLDVNLIMARVTTDYVSINGFAVNDLQNSRIQSNSVDRDIVVVARQTEANADTIKVEVFERNINGSYGTSNKSSSYSPTFNGSSAASQGVNMQNGGSLRISGAGTIDIPSFTKSSSSTLDGFSAYFFAVQDSIDTNIVMTAQGFAESNGSKTKVEPGATINFRLYSLANNGDYLRIQYGNDSEKINIGLANDAPIVSQSGVYRNVAGGFVGSDLTLGVKGYTIGSGTDSFSIQINGHEMDVSSATTGKGKIISTATDLELDEVESRGIYPKIQFEYRDEDDRDNVAQVNVKEFGAQNGSQGDGLTPASLLELNDIDGDGVDDGSDYFQESNVEIVYRGEVLANRYYLLFDQDTDLEEWDAYGNVLTTENGSRRSLELYEYDASGDGNVDSSGGDIYVKFENRDAGEQREVSVESDRGKNTIKFVNIVASTVENDFYIIKPVISAPQVNLVNTEVLLKIIGNNRGVSSDFSLKFVHSDVDAKINIVRLENSTEAFISTLGTSIYDALDENGNYYLIRTDKPGDITIDAIGNEKDEDDRDIVVETTKSIRFVTFDTSTPIAQVDLVGNRVTVLVSDGSLDYDNTIVEARNSEG